MVHSREEDMTENLNAPLQETHKLLGTLYGERLSKIVLYGSQARGDSSPTSDIDLMIVLEGPVNAGKEISRVGEITSGLSLKYNLAISCLFISSDRYLKEQSPLLLNVRREGVAV
jgi:uncharacterized protein